jgi:hypothetical protein
MVGSLLWNISYLCNSFLSCWDVLYTKDVSKIFWYSFYVVISNSCRLWLYPGGWWLVEANGCIFSWHDVRVWGDWFDFTLVFISQLPMFYCKFLLSTVAITFLLASVSVINGKTTGNGCIFLSFLLFT